MNRTLDVLVGTPRFALGRRVADFELRLLRATIDTNSRQQLRMVDKVRIAITGKRTGSLSHTRIGLLGLTFKAGTDDLRDSPALAVAALLRRAGAELVAHDPGVSASSAHPGLDALMVVDDPLLAAKDVDAIVVLTEWPEFRTLDWAAMAEQVRSRVVIDTRNLLDPDVLERVGFTCHTIGRR